jgi:tetratricopeptide (TPR) repeat protein
MPSSVELPGEDNLYVYSLAVAQRALSIVPGEPLRARFHVGKVHARFGMDSLALEEFRSAVESQSVSSIDERELGAEVYREMGFLLSQRESTSEPDRMREAIEAYQLSLLHDPSQSGVYTRIGLLLTHMNLLDEAEEALQAEIRKGSGRADVMTFYQLGQVHSQRQRCEDAVLWFRKSLDVDPNQRQALFGLAECLRLLGKNDEAGKVKEKFLAIKREEDQKELASRQAEDSRAAERRHAADTWVDAAALFLAALRPPELEPRARESLRGHAISALREACRLDPANHLALQLLTKLHRERREGAKAADLYERALQHSPDDAVLLFDLATLRLEQLPQLPREQAVFGQRAGEAHDLLRRAVAASPGFAAAHLALAEVILRFQAEPQPEPQKAQLLEDAVTHARRALESASSPGPGNYDILAWAYSRTGRTHEAVKTLREGTQRHPNDAGLRKRLQQFEGGRQ